MNENRSEETVFFVSVKTGSGGVIDIGSMLTISVGDSDIPLQLAMADIRAFSLT